jgi:hypothetical protein
MRCNINYPPQRRALKLQGHPLPNRISGTRKASDYRISPFELESALIEHPEVVECAVVPSPDPIRSAVPKFL